MLNKQYTDDLWRWASHENNTQITATWEHCIDQASRKRHLEGIRGSLSLLSFPGEKRTGSDPAPHRRHGHEPGRQWFSSRGSQSKMLFPNPL